MVLLINIICVILTVHQKLALAALISANIAVPCPGEILIYTCVAQGNAQQWVVSHRESRLEVTFLREERLGTSRSYFGPGGISYTFTLISTRYHSFTSTVSVVATRILDSFHVECVATGYANVYINIAGNFIIKIAYHTQIMHAGYSEDYMHACRSLLLGKSLRTLIFDTMSHLFTLRTYFSEKLIY